MLVAHANTTTDEFIEQLRTYVIAMGLSPQVVDCVDRLTGESDLEDQHAAEMQQAEDAAEIRGRESMKAEIEAAMNKWLDELPPGETPNAEALLKEVEKVEA
jgi:hypothetical protein